MEVETTSTTSKIAVIGLGFVGLPLALLLTDKGFPVIGIDVDKKKVENLNNGISYIPDITHEEIKKVSSSGKLIAYNHYNSIKEVDVIIICVPTPLTEHHTPDLSFLQVVGKELAPHLKKEQLIILESSTYPGTTKEVLQPILEKSGLKTGVDFYLAYSPERIDPGNKSFKVEEVPKVISGVTDQCKGKIQQLYSKVFQKVVLVSSPEAAEMTKLLENSYRFINISFINEVAMLCDKLNLNIWEIIDAAASKPYGYSPFYPGPGIGGHCIPVDPIYLAWKAKQFNVDTYFLTLAAKINYQLPSYIIDQLQQLLGNISDKNILIIGVSYKKDIDDLRESPAIPIIYSLKEHGANVSFFDPFISEVKLDRSIIKGINLTDEALYDADCVLLLTDHSNLPLEQIVTNTKIVYDTRNVLKGKKGKASVYVLGGGHL